jgi:DNA-binding MarR family transcriptional regulator
VSDIPFTKYTGSFYHRLVSIEARDLIALQRATHALILALDAELDALGLSASETNLLACLTPDGPRRIAELVAATGQRPSTVTGILDRLERRGLVERQLDLDDRRSFRIALTPDGVSMYGWVREGYENVAARTRDGLEGVASPDLQTVLRAIERVR